MLGLSAGASANPELIGRWLVADMLTALMS
jgi:hypothetical protein